MNPYETLGVKANATQAEIRSAYRKLAKQFHPDVNIGNKKAEQRFKEINAAYELIGDENSRAKFDRGETEEQQAGPGAGGFYQHFRHQGGPSSHSFQGMDEDLFESLFGGGKGFRSQAPDEIYQLSIDFRDSILGAEKDVTLPGGKKLHVKIPAGIETGKKLRFASQSSGAQSRDIFIEIHVKPSAIFTRVGNNVEIEVPISTSEAILGTEIMVPTVDGTIILKVPKFVSSGQKLRIAGKGVQHQGDQLVKIKIVNPPATSATDEEFLKAVEEWSKKHPFNPRTDKSQ